MYEIVDYDLRYRPHNKSGGELVSPDYVKLPVNPKGDGLQSLLERRRGTAVFGIWCLLLEKTTAEKKPENRGKLLNHRGQPANISEIAKGISHKRKERLVEYALSVLCETGWLSCSDSAELCGTKFRKGDPKLKLKLKLKEKEKEKMLFLNFVYLTKEEHQKLITQYGEQSTRKLVENLDLYIGSKGNKYKSHYFTLLNWARREGVVEIVPTKPIDPEAEAAALEKKKQEARGWTICRKLKDMKTKELKKILISKDGKVKRQYFTLRWYIKELLAERKRNENQS